MQNEAPALPSPPPVSEPLPLPSPAERQQIATVLQLHASTVDRAYLSPSMVKPTTRLLVASVATAMHRAPPPKPPEPVK
jgi:hypothetical protein